MTAGFPHGWVHKYAGIDANDIAMEQHHALPPVFFDVVFQLNTILTVVINGCESVVNLTAREDKAVFLAVAHYLFENIFLCHNRIFFKVLCKDTINIAKQGGFYYFL